MQLISTFNTGFRSSLFVIRICSKYAWVVSLKDKKGITIVNAFQSILNESKRKLNKIWVDKGSQVCNRSQKSWLQHNNTEMYSTNSEGKSVVAERLLITLKNKIFKHMILQSKNVCIDALDDAVDKLNNSYHTTIKMKPVDIKSSNYIEYNVNSNDKDPKF